MELQDDAGHTDSTTADIRVSVENVGGIDRAEVSFTSGVTVLTGRNATNRTSLLRALSGALGGDAATLRSDADDGRVELHVGTETYDRTFERVGESVATGGDPCTGNADLVTLFATLLADNPIRRAVERGDDLRDLVMRPVNTEEIRRNVRTLESERDDVESRIEAIEERRDRLPALEERKRSLEAELDSIDEELTELRDRIAGVEADESAAERAEELVEDLQAERRTLDDLRDRLDHQESEIEALEAEREDVEADLASLEVPDDPSPEIATLRERKRDVENTVDDLLRIVEFNDDLVDGEPVTVLDGESGDVTASLDPMSETVECWTCGSDVDREAIVEQLDTLRAVVEDKRSELAELEAELSELEAAKRRRETRQERRRELEGRLDEIDREIAHRESNVEDLEAEVETTREEIAALETRVEETEELRESDLVRDYQRLSELEYERGKLETERERAVEEIAEIEEAAGELDRLRERRAEYEEELAALRTRIETLERTAVEEFNDHMAAVLDRLGYDNVERVWIERLAREDDATGSATFELHVVRESPDGSVYEDTVDTLSESEREVIGLVLALAGYLVHDVYEEVPMVLLDSLEAFDAERIEALVEYVAEFAPTLVVALLPEDERRLPDRYERVPADQLRN